MFAHVAIRASDFVALERFYRASLGALGIEPTIVRDDLVVWDDFALLPASPERPTTRNLHIAFVVPTHEHMRAFWRAGLGAGGDDDGKPDERPQYTPSYYGAFLRDPDGNSAEAVIHYDTRRGGNIDHLWIGVRDLEAASGFYGTVARHTGFARAEAGRAGVSFAVHGRPSRSSPTGASRPRTCTSRFLPLTRGPSRTSTPPLSPPATATTALPGSVRNTAPVTTAPSCLIPTRPTSSRSSATAARSRRDCAPSAPSASPCPPAGHGPLCDVE